VHQVATQNSQISTIETLTNEVALYAYIYKPCEVFNASPDFVLQKYQPVGHRNEEGGPLLFIFLFNDRVSNSKVTSE
jgi:hypothetical protein